MNILDGKKVSEKVLANVKARVESLNKQPFLNVILVGDDPASKLYVNNKRKTAEKIGIRSIKDNFKIYNY